MKDYNVLDSTSPINGRIFIEASAGTGKTFAIEHMVTRLILQGTCITNILVVTFTKAGAKDLKSRIHKNLLSITDNIKERNYTIPYLENIKNTEEALLLLENACALCNEMPIYTIHGFAFHMLNVFAFEAKTDLDLISFEEDKHKDLSLQAILDTFRSISDESLVSAAQVTKIMDLSKRKLSTLTGKITQIMGNLPEDIFLPAYQEIKEHFATLIGQVDTQTLQSEMIAIASNYKKTTNRAKEIHPFLTKQIHLLANKDLDALLLEKQSIIELLHSSNLKKNAAKATHYQLPSLIDSLYNIFIAAKDPSFTLTHLANLAKQRLEKMNVQSPDSILLSMLNAGKRKGFFDKVSSLFSVCIIDEFQDTDPVQWDILSTLFFDSAKLFCTVGDPKQSIYAFRGADLPTYLLAKKKFSSIFSLSTNYRSTKHLVDGLNTLFSPKTVPDFLSFKKGDTDLFYQHILAGKTDPSRSDLQLYVCPAIKKRTVKSSIIEMEEQSIFPHIVNTIIDLNIDLDQIAILVKDRYQGLRVSLYLQKAGIDVKANINTSLLKTPMFSFIETCIFLSYNPRDESLIKKLLASEIINAPLSLLKQDLHHPILQNISIQFSLLKDVLTNKGTRHFIAKLMDISLDGKLRIEEVICQNEEFYQTMQQIITLLLTNFEKDLKLFISEIQKLNVDNFPWLKKQSDTDQKSVTIMTSHLSKGLEFDAVFAVSLYTRMKGSGLDQNEAFNIDKEKMRLLYVTLTRAKSFLYIYATTFNSLFPLENGGASPIELFLARVNNPFISYEKVYEIVSSLNEKEVLRNCPISCSILEKTTPKHISSDCLYPKTLPPTPMQSYEKKEFFTSFSSLPFEKHPIEYIEEQPSFPRGAKAGHQIHLIMEKIIEEGLYYPFTKESIYPVIEESFFGSELFGYEEIVYEKIKETFMQKLHGKNFSFSLEQVPPGHMQQEVYFEYTLDGSNKVMKGFIDLIVCVNDTFFIIDWKCNHLTAYDKVSLQAAMEKNTYEKQARIYMQALKHFLQGKNMDFSKHAGGAFYLFLRADQDKSIFVDVNPMNDDEVLCLL